MSALSRVSLHDCTVEVSIPLPASLSAASSTTRGELPTPEEATLLAADSRPRERTEAYVGDTLFIIVTITGPVGGNCTTDLLYQALDGFGDVQVYMGRDRASARSCSLPVLKESRWVGTTRSEKGKNESLPLPPAPVLSKGVWALVRTPPEQSHQADVMSVAGKQEVIVVLREKSVSHGLRNSSVWATIDRASRLFGKTIALTAAKPLMVDLPLEISCSQVRVAKCSEKAFICITARNATGDASVSIVPPYINVNSSQVVEDPEVNPRASRSNVDIGNVPGNAKEPVSLEIALDEWYEFVPLFTVGDSGDDEDTLSDMSSDTSPDFRRSQSAGTVSCDDYGLFIPSFNHWLKRSVSLGPREAFNFVYKIIRRGESQHKGVSSDTLPAQTENGAFLKRQSSLGPNPIRKLKPGTCLETSVAVAWSCSPLEAGLGIAGFSPDKQETLRREMSSGGVLATGKRGNVAVRLTSVHWRPPALLDGVIVTFTGPPLATVGEKISISVGVFNQTGTDLQEAVVLVQQEEGKEMDLLALRTVIAVGRIAAGCETTLELPCLALRAGALSLGPVQVLDRSNEAGANHAWTSHATFEILVVDDACKIRGDPQPPTTEKPSDATLSSSAAQ